MCGKKMLERKRKDFQGPWRFIEGLDVRNLYNIGRY